MKKKCLLICTISRFVLNSELELKELEVQMLRLKNKCSILSHLSDPFGMVNGCVKKNIFISFLINHLSALFAMLLCSFIDN